MLDKKKINLEENNNNKKVIMQKYIKNILNIFNIKNVNNTQKELFKSIAIILITVLISTTVSKRLITKNQLKNKQIVSVNLTGILKDFTINLAKTDKKDQELINSIKDFSSSLEKLLKEVAETNNLIIIPSQASIAGTKDITKDIKVYLNDKQIVGVDNAKTNL